MGRLPGSSPAQGDTLAKRERLSKAVFPAVQIREDGIAEVQEVESGWWHEFDPYTNPADWMELAEWVRLQEWFAEWWCSVGSVRVMLGHGPILTALPDAVYQAIVEMEEKDGK